MKRYRKFEKVSLGLLIILTILSLSFFLYEQQVNQIGYQFYGTFNNFYHTLLVVFYTLSAIVAGYWIFQFLSQGNSPVGKVLRSIIGMGMSLLVLFLFFMGTMNIFMLSYHDEFVTIDNNQYVVRVHSWLDISFEYYATDSDILIPKHPEFSAILKDDDAKNYHDSISNLDSLIIVSNNDTQ